jgi:hypothetical protein
MTKAAQISRMQRQLGCPGCRFADLNSLYKKECCRYPGKLSLDAETGKCLTRQIQSAVEPAHSIPEAVR